MIGHTNAPEPLHGAALQARCWMGPSDGRFYTRVATQRTIPVFGFSTSASTGRRRRHLLGTYRLQPSETGELYFQWYENRGGR